MDVRVIVSYSIKKYGTNELEHPTSRTKLMRHYTKNLNERDTIGIPPTIPVVLLNITRLHKIVL